MTTRRLEGRVALITGAGRGIGRATAELFAREGSRVMVATRGEAAGLETVAAIRQAGGQAELVTLDLSSREAVKRTIQATLAAFGQLDIIVHNSASTPYAAMGDVTDASLDDAFNANLKPAFWFAGEAPKVARPSCILVVSSITGNRQWQPGYSVYGASKAGLNSFVRMAASELGPQGIRVNGVEPGLTLTEAVKAKFPEAEAQKIKRIIPLGDTAQPEDIAYALLYLGSDEAKHVTGQIISVDGGQSLASAGG